MIQLLDEGVTDADGIRTLGLEWSTGIHEMLVEFDDRRCHRLAIWASTRLPNMVQRSMGLITVIRAQLREDTGGNLIESQLEDLGVNPLDEAVHVDIDFSEIEVSLEEGNRPILEDNIEDEKADILGRQSGQIAPHHAKW